MFSCPKCGTKCTVSLIRVAGAKVVGKQRCPLHGVKSFRFPMMQLKSLISYIQDSVYRCYKCGQEAIQDQVRMNGPWTLVKCACAIHGNKLPWQKIWNSIYFMMPSKSTTLPQPTEQESMPEPTQIQPQQPQIILSEESKICPNCGAKLKGNEKFCEACGAPTPQENKFCPNCGAPIEEIEKFCGDCGATLGPD